MSLRLQTSPFFILGCGRSGTTLLKSILLVHPELFVTPETFFFRSIQPQIAKSADEPWLAVDRWWLADSDITPQTLRPFVERRLGEGEPSDKAVLGAILDFHAEANPGMKIGEKTPQHVQHLDELRRFFPEAPIIQIQRDPRAVLASYRKVQIGSSAIADIVAKWSDSTNTLEEWAGRENYLSIRYEDLVTKPEDTLRRICDLLGVNWVPDILNFHQRKTDGFSAEQVHHANTRRPLFADRLDGWRNELSEKDVGLLEWALKDQMQRHDYAPDGVTVDNPKLRLKLSHIGDKIDRLVFRVPRQKLKMLRAKRRQSEESS